MFVRIPYEFLPYPTDTHMLCIQCYKVLFLCTVASYSLGIVMSTLIFQMGWQFTLIIFILDVCLMSIFQKLLINKYITKNY